MQVSRLTVEGYLDAISTSVEVLIMKWLVNVANKLLGISRQTCFPDMWSMGSSGEKKQ
jgi:hypothetical protein